jgi:hypothetical protein
LKHYNVNHLKWKKDKYKKLNTTKVNNKKNSLLVISAIFSYKNLLKDPTELASVVAGLRSTAANEIKPAIASYQHNLLVAP